MEQLGSHYLQSSLWTKWPECRRESQPGGDLNLTQQGAAAELLSNVQSRHVPRQLYTLNRGGISHCIHTWTSVIMTSRGWRFIVYSLCHYLTIGTCLQRRPKDTTMTCMHASIKIDIWPVIDPKLVEGIYLCALVKLRRWHCSRSSSVHACTFVQWELTFTRLFCRPREKSEY